MVVESGALWGIMARNFPKPVTNPMAKSTGSSPIFSGEFRHALDDKNRITIPAKWRGGEDEDLFIFKNPNRACLTVMARDVFQQVGENLKASVTATEHRAFMTQFYSRAKTCAIDKQGRLLVPDEQCKAVNLKTEVVLTGGSDRFDLWSPTNWEAAQVESASIFERVSASAGL